MTDPFRTPQEEQQYREHLALFDRDARVVVEGTPYAWSEDDLHELASARASQRTTQPSAVRS